MVKSYLKASTRDDLALTVNVELTIAARYPRFIRGAARVPSGISKPGLSYLQAHVSRVILVQPEK